MSNEQGEGAAVTALLLRQMSSTGESLWRQALHFFSPKLFTTNGARFFPSTSKLNATRRIPHTRTSHVVQGAIGGLGDA